MSLPPPSHHIIVRSRSAPGRGPHQSGFTLLELLIACAIALVLLGVSLYLFGQTTALTRVSLGRAELALTAQTFEARLRDDALYLLGPNRDPAQTGGCLVIVPALRRGFIPLSNGQMSANRVQLRSDQLVFFSKRDPANPRPWVSLLPEDGNTPPQNTSYEARLWYGAVRDANLTGDGTNQDGSQQAHLWKVGRDLKLIQKTTTGPLDATVQSSLDITPGGPTAGPATPGGLINLKNMALSVPAWTDQDYVDKLIGKDASNAAIPNDKTNYTNQPTITPRIDLKALQRGQGIENGIQLSDLAEAHTRLLENCSEIVVQWAGDLDKDGQIDFYPANHPLAGSLIWYPEELHSTAQKNTFTKAKLSGTLLAKYNLIDANPWTNAFPAGFSPALGAWPNGRFGDAPTSGTWADRFQFDYGEADNAPNQTTATPKVPAPYVFRFDDDQYRLVRFGFRQDGSIYKNKHDGKLLPAQTWSSTASYAANSLVWYAGNNYANGAAVAAPVAPDVNPPPPAAPWTAAPRRHWTPYPPTPALATTNPTPGQLYTGAAPAGPYPRATTGTPGAAGLNFGDVLGDRDIPTTGQPGANGAPCREAPPTWPLWAGSESAQAIVHYPTAADPLYYALPTIVAGDIPGTSPNWAPIPQPIPDYAGAGTAYPPGSFVHNGGKIYCNTADIPGGVATAYVAGNAYAANAQVTHLGSSYYPTVSIPTLASMPPWADDATYAAGSFVSHDGVGYRAASAITTPPTIDPVTGETYDPPLTMPEPPHEPWQVVGPPDASPLWVENTPTGNPAWQEVSPPPYGYRIRISQVGRILSKASPVTATAGAPAVAAASTVDAQTAVAAKGDEPVFTDGMNPYALMTSDFGPGNNHTVTYADLWAEYFKPVNTTALQGTTADWRNPQSDWPKLLRIRLRLHDAHGKITSYSDEALINGRDDDGDGAVDNPEEGRGSGIWYEFVIAVPYPMDPTPRQH